MNRNEGDGATVEVWWTPDCGHLHAETNPVTIPFHCPDNVAPPDDDEETP